MSNWKRAWEGDWSQINEEQQATTRPQEQKHIQGTPWPVNEMNGQTHWKAQDETQPM
jgi:hypothetical protein